MIVERGGGGDVVVTDGSLCVFLQPTRSSSESICSRPGSSIPGSPGHTIYVRRGSEFDTEPTDCLCLFFFCFVFESRVSLLLKVSLCSGVERLFFGFFCF